MNTTLSGNVFKTKTKVFSLVRTKSSVAKNKPIRYLAIGDSITAADASLYDGSKVGCWNYSSAAKQIAMMDDKDLGGNLINVLLIGTFGMKERNFEYKSQTYTLRGRDEGRGSWTTSNYLRHAMHTTTTSEGTETLNQFKNKAAWDALGLGRKISIDGTYDETVNYEEYTASSTQRLLINSTPWGKYHWDYSLELWNAAKNINRGGIMNGAGNYTGSSEDKALLDSYMNYVLEHPDNPFFDKNIAKQSGDIAFSINTYLNRYKTLDTDGATRLVVGSTAGNFIDASNINDIDVCLPTHITIELGENDRWWYPCTAQITCQDLMKMANAINSEQPSIKVGFVNPRWPGVHYPENWYDKGICGELGISSNVYKYSMNKILQEELGNLQEQTQNFLVPSYYTQTPISRQENRLDEDLCSLSSIIVGGTDPNHPGYYAHFGIGYQVLSWIYYTLTLA